MIVHFHPHLDERERENLRQKSQAFYNLNSLVPFLTLAIHQRVLLNPAHMILACSIRLASDQTMS